VEAFVTRSPTRPLLFLGALLLLAGCATVPMESAQEEARGKQFSPPPPDKGSLYVFRRGFMGAVVTIPVTIAGTQTQLAQNTWVWLEPAPATIDIKCTGSEGGAELAEVPAPEGRAAVLAGKRAVGP
jgi:hypothetical protein